VKKKCKELHLELEVRHNYGRYNKNPVVAVQKISALQSAASKKQKTSHNGGTAELEVDVAVPITVEEEEENQSTVDADVQSLMAFKHKLVQVNNDKYITKLELLVGFEGDYRIEDGTWIAFTEEIRNWPLVKSVSAQFDAGLFDGVVSDYDANVFLGTRESNNTKFRTVVFKHSVTLQGCIPEIFEIEAEEVMLRQKLSSEEHDLELWRTHSREKNKMRKALETDESFKSLLNDASNGSTLSEEFGCYDNLFKCVLKITIGKVKFFLEVYDTSVLLSSRVLFKNSSLLLEGVNRKLVLISSSSEKPLFKTDVAVWKQFKAVTKAFVPRCNETTSEMELTEKLIVDIIAPLP
jgi:hypothetical protein